MHRWTRRGQSLTEYAIVFSVVAAAIIGMQIFVKRGLQAKEKDASEFLSGVTGDPLAADGITTAGTISTVTQYEPYYIKETYTGVETVDKSKTDVAKGFTIGRSDIEQTRKRAIGGKTETGAGDQLIEDKDWTEKVE